MQDNNGLTGPDVLNQSLTKPYEINRLEKTAEKSIVQEIQKGNQIKRLHHSLGFTRIITRLSTLLRIFS